MSLQKLADKKLVTLPEDRSPYGKKKNLYYRRRRFRTDGRYYGAREGGEVTLLEHNEKNRKKASGNRKREMQSDQYPSGAFLLSQSVGHLWPGRSFRDFLFRILSAFSLRSAFIRRIGRDIFILPACRLPVSRNCWKWKPDTGK